MAISPKPKKRKRPAQRTACQRGYGSKWQKESALWIAAHPACVECGWIDVRSKMVVDHVIPHRGNQLLFWDTDNWQTLCRKCHNAKTVRGE